VEASREVQRQRFTSGGEAEKGILSNADMHNADIRKYCPLDEPCQNLMRAAMQQMHLSARAYHRIIKLARTIADLARSDAISAAHLAEALQYRPQVF
jgi:magnesium chelatase family protein